ncbi:MAG TPA: DUF3618 domain-containing protein [Burkholderiales bacterium]|nr:DUF3618 domain-containing protein [Burkholderiales bacterium]
MKHNGERRPEEIQAEIQRTRSHMDETLSAIESRLTPGQLMDRGIDYLRHNGGTEFVQNLGNQAKNNPMPVALMGIGLAWLMATGRSGGDALSSAESSWQGARERMGHAKETLSVTAQSTRERISGAAASAKETYERARGGYDSMMRDHPLALGAVGLAIGAVIAAALPRTRKEDELMGEQRDRLAGQAKELGREQFEKAKDAVKNQSQGTPKPATPAQAVGATGAGQPPRRGPGGG